MVKYVHFKICVQYIGNMYKQPKKHVLVECIC